MIEFNKIYNGLYDVIDEGIGNIISDNGFGSPSIYQFGDSSEKGTYPFVVIERGPVTNRDGSLRQSRRLDENSHQVTTTEKVVTYFLRVIGSGEEDPTTGVYTTASEICSILEGFIRSERASAVFEAQTECSAIGLILASTPAWSGTGADILETCSLAITINTTLTHTDTTVEVFDTVNVQINNP